MSRPSEAEIAGVRPGVDPPPRRGSSDSVGAWALALGVPAMCFWYIAPIVIVIAVIGIVRASGRGDRRELNFAVTGLCLALIGIILAGVRLMSSVAA